MKKKIINWIREILGINQMQKNLSKTTTDIEREIGMANSLAKELQLLKNELQVGVDVHQRSPSWAVVCVKGKKADYIKLFNFDEKDEREIRSFLKQFQERNVIIDKPFGLPKEYYFR